MNTLLLWSGRLAGIAGALICLIAIGARLSGISLVVDFQPATLLLAGMSVMLMGCLCLLAVLTLRR